MIVNRKVVNVEILEYTGTWNSIHIKGFAIEILHAGHIFSIMGSPKKIVWTFAAIGIFSPPVMGFEPTTSDWV